jgi:hypothetical protein
MILSGTPALPHPILQLTIPAWIARIIGDLASDLLTSIGPPLPPCKFITANVPFPWSNIWCVFTLQESLPVQLETCFDGQHTP